MSTESDRAVHLVVKLLFANLAYSVFFCALMLIFRENILAFQMAKQPAVPRDALELVLWTRPLRVVLVAAVDVWLARRLIRRVPRAYRRMQFASITGLAYVGWVISQGSYPVWLSVAAGGELILLAAMVFAVNRPAMRAAFARPGNGREELAPR